MAYGFSLNVLLFTQRYSFQKRMEETAEPLFGFAKKKNERVQTISSQTENKFE